MHAFPLPAHPFVASARSGEDAGGGGRRGHFTSGAGLRLRLGLPRGMTHRPWPEHPSHSTRICQKPARKRSFLRRLTVLAVCLAAVAVDAADKPNIVFA